MSSGARTVERLVEVARSFGPAAAREKEYLIGQIEDAPPGTARALRSLHATLCFLTAYPDSPTVRQRVRRLSDRLRSWVEEVDAGHLLLGTGVPGSHVLHEFGLPVVRRMSEAFPRCLEIAWDELDEELPLQNWLGALLTPGENHGLDDIDLSLSDWFSRVKPQGMTDLESLIALFDAAGLDLVAAETAWECCALPVRYELLRPGTGSCEIRWPAGRSYYQREPVRNERIPLEPEIRRQAEIRPQSVEDGRRHIEAGLATLCARGLEIRTLMYGNPRDVHVVECGRGVRVALIGVIPEYRDPLESHYCCFAIKNGVAIGYGPASVSFGCCEIGLNLFPEFRGAEIRWLYPQYLRAIHQVLGAQCFYMTSYGMGEGNPEAIRSGAFWFYRKLGFQVVNPEVEALAQSEEAKMRRDPGYRSGRRILRRMAKTDVRFDLSGGQCTRLQLGSVGVRLSRLIADEFGGDRGRAVRAWVRRADRALGVARGGSRAAGHQLAFEMLAPILGLIEDLSAWSRADKRSLLGILRAKGGPSERSVDARMLGHVRFREAIRRLTQEA